MALLQFSSFRGASGRDDGAQTSRGDEHGFGDLRLWTNQNRLVAELCGSESCIGLDLPILRLRRERELSGGLAAGFLDRRQTNVSRGAPFFDDRRRTIDFAPG